MKKPKKHECACTVIKEYDDNKNTSLDYSLNLIAGIGVIGGWLYIFSLFL